MRQCDAIVVGAGPAGSACAAELTAAGREVVLVDRAVFPRDKVCAGWIPPGVFRLLKIDPGEYGRGRTLQALTGFRVEVFPGRAHFVRYAGTVSYGIRRSEWDEYLARRSGADFLEGTWVDSLDRVAGGWMVNGWLRSEVVVGAGGHFCPVARRSGAVPGRECAVVGEAVEYRLEDAASCPVEGETAELYFCRDLRGYGWCVRKGEYLNVGFGRLGREGYSAQCRAFLHYLCAMRGIVLAKPLVGHAYLLSSSARQALGDGIWLVGDALGVASPVSGEGIGPSIRSGIWAARGILGSRERWAPEGGRRWPGSLWDAQPERLRGALARGLMARGGWFCRAMLDRCFLAGA